MSQTIYLVVFIQAQGQNHERVEIRANGFFDTGGLYLVCLSRTKDIKHILIGPQDMPNHLDIRLQRLDIDVIDAQAFYRELRVSGAVTLRKQSTKHPGLYGVSWSDEETVEIGSTRTNKTCKQAHRADRAHTGRSQHAHKH